MLEFPSWIAREKLRDYLLSPVHPIGRYKALFFRTLGYDQTSWQELETDLRSLASLPAEFIGVDRIWHQIRDYWAVAGPERARGRDRDGMD